MKDIKLDQTTHDLFFKDGDLVLIEKNEWVAQKLKTKLLFFYGEWFLDISKGMDFYDIIFKKNVDLSYIDTLIKITIAEVEEVVEILEYDSSITMKKLSVNFKVSTIYGDVEIREEISL